MRYMLLCTFLAAGLAGCGQNEADVRRIIREELASSMERTTIRSAEVSGPYSPAVRVGNFLFVSGQIAIDPQTGGLKNENIEMEVRQVLDNLLAVLRREGYDSSHVVSVTVYLKNMNDYQKMNLIYGGYFAEGEYPARVAVEVSNLPRQANVEMSAIAYKRQQPMERTPTP